ncbi:MAG: nucleotidyl transferase AbiEii/AbiGii toxin family protein [Epsilonproteobacteria bacterium]|nr:nucleotidyl transferase AbiEii/AbiGii toxin family protein [Campylobacterota bacterium]
MDKIALLSSTEQQEIFSETAKLMNTTNAIVEKDFWEKATILHQESNRVESKVLLPRYSRHYYDMAIMAKSDVKQEALDDLLLLEQVVDFKIKFYPATWAKFEDAKPNTLKLVPPMFRLNELKKDYKAMASMIFDKYLSFDEIIDTLQKLEDEINSSSTVKELIE